MTVWPNALLKRLAISRLNVSLLPPGGQGLINLIGCSGKGWATA
jgi:hypothetical protein